jgi:hypothetical protein
MLHLPLSLEDRTGLNTASDFDDIYDRVFLHVAAQPGTSSNTVNIYKMSQRGSRRRDALPFNPTTPPAATLSFGPRDSLGTVSFGTVPANGGGGAAMAMAMGQYLKKTSLFGGSLSRKFVGSDGREYRWNYRSVEGQEWTVRCLRSNSFYLSNVFAVHGGGESTGLPSGMLHTQTAEHARVQWLWECAHHRRTVCLPLRRCVPHPFPPFYYY